MTITRMKNIAKFYIKSVIKLDTQIHLKAIENRLGLR